MELGRKMFHAVEHLFEKISQKRYGGYENELVGGVRCLAFDLKLCWLTSPQFDACYSGILGTL